MNNKRLRQLAGLPPLNEQQLNEEQTYSSSDDMHTKAIAMIDDVLASLPENEQYGERGDILRYILKVLQGGNRQISPDMVQKQQKTWDM